MTTLTLAAVARPCYNLTVLRRHRGGFCASTTNTNSCIQNPVYLASRLCLRRLSATGSRGFVFRGVVVDEMDATKERVCSTCGQVWPLTLEYWPKHTLPALQNNLSGCRQCKLCKAASSRRRRRRPGQKEKDAAYRQRPEVKARDRKRERYRVRTPEYKAKKAERDRKRDHKARYQKRKKDPVYMGKFNQYRRNYYARKKQDPEYRKERAAYQREYMRRERENLRKWEADHGIPPRKKKQTEKETVTQQNRRAVREGVVADLTIEQWIATLESWGFKCAYCGGEYQVMEHIIPVSQGGGTTVDNCVPACFSCNIRKLNMTPDELGDFQKDVVSTMWKHLFWVTPAQGGVD